MKLNYFNFKVFKDKILLTNDLGRYVFVKKNEFKNIINNNIDLQSTVGKELLDNKMIYNETDY